MMIRMFVQRAAMALFMAVAIGTAQGAAPATAPAVGSMSRCDGQPIAGPRFERPTLWALDELNPRPNEVRFCEVEPWEDHVQSSLTVLVENHSTPVSIDISSPANPAASVDKVVTVDGENARLVVFTVPTTDGTKPIAEVLTLSVAKAKRLFTITLVFPLCQHGRYLLLADRIVSTMHLPK